MRTIVPISQLTQRPPELGRIRIGAKTAKAMKALDTFRFTSSDRTALDQIAAHYGGTVKPWSDPKAAEGQYEVVTDASEIRVALPADPLGGTPRYELYGGGGRERWCDGETCETWVDGGPDGPEPRDVPCVCVAKGELACKPTVHLSVILPDVRGIGTWRLTTHSWNAAQEMPGVVSLIVAAQARGIQRGTLSIKRRPPLARAGRTRKFPVPTLGLDASYEELVAGKATVGRLSSAAVGEIGAGPASPGGGEGTAALPVAEEAPEPVASTAPSVESVPPAQPEIVDAVVVGDYPDGWDDLAGPGKNKALRLARELAAEHGQVVPGSFDEIDADLAVATWAVLS